MTTDGMTTVPPRDVLVRMAASDPGRPRLTWYDDLPGPTEGERIELSARVLANWVSKAANLLQDDAAAGPGTTVGLDLPAHWRSLYSGPGDVVRRCAVVVGDAAAGADVLVTDSPRPPRPRRRRRPRLPARLARSHPEAGDAPGRSTRRASCRPTATAFSPMSDAEPDDVALAAERRHGIRSLVVADATGARPSRVALQGGLEEVLRTALAAWAADGSDRARAWARPTRRDRLAAEGVSVDARDVPDAPPRGHGG